MSSVLFISLISRDDRPLYIQSFDGKLGEKNVPESEKTEVSESNSASISNKPETDSLSPADANKFLKYNFLSHMALDVFASPMSLHLREQQGDPDGILLLFIQDGVTVYGMETNNGLRMVAGISEEVPYKTSLKSLFSQIHKCYLKTVCNPFTDVSNSGDYEKVLSSKAFDGRMKTIVDGWR